MVELESGGATKWREHHAGHLSREHHRSPDRSRTLPSLVASDGQPGPGHGHWSAPKPIVNCPGGSSYMACFRSVNGRR